MLKKNSGATNREDIRAVEFLALGFGLAILVVYMITTI